MTNPYINFALGFQALRRDVERRRSPLQGALGVRADLYPHQLANVRRILVAEEIRHLLADEVGLGKTVQALMVVNALRLQRPDLRVLILVPNRLVPQWRDEILIRAHLAPIEHVPDPNETRLIRLAWPANITPQDISANNYDLLIVDELHQLTTDLQDRVTLEAPSFKHFLILTATPNFRVATRHVQLFLALEPARTALASTVVANSEDGREARLGEEPRLSKWPEWALNGIVATFLARDREIADMLNRDGGNWDYYGGEPPKEERERSAALAHCAYRRIIRTRRKDYRGILPDRNHHRIVVEPTFGEVERQRLMWEYFTHLHGLGRDFDEVRLAKRVILSSPSLKQRVDFLRRKGYERNDILAKVTPLLSNDQGDSRLDALTDLLGKIWRNNPSERVLVAAQDNLTVDYLFNMISARLPQIGPRTNRVPLIPARVRQGMMVEAVDDLAGFGNETNENLEAFQRGEAQILFAPEIAQVGLNLQCARILVLYSVPWSPEEVEQWIGRLDRIGNSAIQTENDGVLPVDVYTIVQHGMVDEKVVTILEHFRVFDRNINLDGEHLREIVESIEVAALRPQEMNWAALEHRADDAAAEDARQELFSDLQSFLPWGAEDAKRVRDWIESLPPAPGALRVLPNRTGPLSWDRAIDGWTRLLNKANEYKFVMGQRDALDHNSRFSSVWYKYGEFFPFHGGRELLSQVQFDESSGIDNPRTDRHPRNALAFITQRKNIQQPPRREVHMTIGTEWYLRPLHFLNHGDPLHEDLLRGWVDLLPQVPNYIEVHVPGDHNAIQNGGEGIYILRVAIVDPADCLPSPVDEAIHQVVAEAATQLTPEKMLSVLPPYLKEIEAGIEADIRWLRGHLPVMLQISSMRHDRGQWRLVNDDFVESILNPYATESQQHPVSRVWNAPAEIIQKSTLGFKMLREQHATEARNNWSARLPTVDREIESRVYTVTVDGQYAVDMRRITVDKTEHQLAVAKHSGVSLSIGRADAAYRTAADVAAVVEASFVERIKWLCIAADAARRPKSVTQQEIVIRLLSQG